ncbi:hypothetical protein HYPSUDRAFT_44985, partial [Hypholoma sublateritium FD-334 SS-4]
MARNVHRGGVFIPAEVRRFSGLVSRTLSCQEDVVWERHTRLHAIFVAIADALHALQRLCGV